ncbi:MAG: hypothetical protein LBB82_06780 [Treponema sp.]|jgi:hypothetical protein|nr:hypothetical protein [Treponema sp.]
MPMPWFIPIDELTIYRVKTYEEQTPEQSLTMGYKNIIDGQYNAEELRKTI